MRCRDRQILKVIELFNDVHLSFYQFSCKREGIERDTDDNETQYPDEYSIGKERNENLVSAIFETVDEERPRWKRQRKKIVADKNPKVPNHNKVNYADYKSISDTFFQHTVYMPIPLKALIT
jgi:hypothetical protein